MKMNKIIINLVLLLTLVFSVNAVLNEGVVSSWHLDNNDLTDELGVNNFTNEGTINGSGIINDARDFDTNTDRLTLSNDNSLDLTGEYSYNLWVNLDTNAGNDFTTFLTYGNQIDFPRYGATLRADSTIKVWGGSGGNTNVDTTAILGTGSYQMLTVTHSGSGTDQTSIYIDGVQIQNFTLADATSTTGTPVLTVGGWVGGGANSINGRIDEPTLWNRSLSVEEVQQLYNSGLGLQYPYVITPLITSDLQTYYNTSNITINLTTETNTNMSYVLDNASEIIICTNCNNSILNLNSIVDGLHNITWISTDSGGQLNNTESFTIDSVNPVINNSIPTTINDYNFLSTFFTCVDDNLDFCNISIDGLNKDQDLNFTLIHNGNLSYTINASDLAGNQVTESGVLFVNPKIFFSFNDSGSPVLNYEFGGRTDVNGFVNYTIYEDSLIIGNNTLNFDKLGFILQNFTFELTNTTNVNFSFNVNPANINIQIFDRVTETLITDNTTVQLIGNIGEVATTITGEVTFQAINATLGDYQIIASSSNYNTESAYFEYTAQENITIKLYQMKTNETNLGQINVLVKDSLSFLVENSIVNLLEWKPTESAYVTVAQCQTASNGICVLNVELFDKLYKLQAVKDNAEKTTNAQIFTVSGVTIPITLEDIILTQVSDLENVFYTVNETLTVNNSLVRLQWTDLTGVVSEACISTFKYTGFGQTLLSENCSSSSSGILFQSNIINNTFDISIKATITSNGVEYPIDEFNHKGIGNLGDALEQNNLHIILPIVFFFIGLGAGLFFGNLFIALSLVILLEWVSVAITKAIITVEIAVAITVLCLLIFWGIKKK